MMLHQLPGQCHDEVGLRSRAGRNASRPNDLSLFGECSILTIARSDADWPSRDSWFGIIDTAIEAEITKETEGVER